MSNENEKIEVRDLREGDWLWTEKKILFSEHVSDSAFKVYCGLASYSGNHDQRSWPALDTLAEKLHLSRSTVIRSLKVLELTGCIGVEKRPGTSNMYSLLKIGELHAPVVKKQQSPHHRLVDVFHKASIRFRNVKPQYGDPDMAALKKAIKADLLTVQEIEQLMIYFMASPSLKKFAPSLAVFFSGGIFTGLMNTMKNGEMFWKDLDIFTTQFYGDQKPQIVRMNTGKMESMAEAIKAMGKRMAPPGGGLV